MKCPDGEAQEGACTYSKEQARQIFQNAFRDGAVIWTSHARQRLLEAGRTANDVIHLSRIGTVVREPEQDIKTGELTFRIESQNLKAVFVIPHPTKVRILTIIANS